MSIKSWLLSVSMKNSHYAFFSGDSGGGICVWSISIPFREEPLKKWYEEKDWHYSGIHALAVSENGYLYTGSGDKLIKKLSLQDGNLSCTISGHKSDFSTLAVSNGVLYSGSWDGTVRLWSLSDHRGNKPGTATPVLSLAADPNALVATYENGSVKLLFRSGRMMCSGNLYKYTMAPFSLLAWRGNGFLREVGTEPSAQELAGDDFQVDLRAIRSIPCDSAVTALSYWEGKLFVGFGDKTVKVYYHGM